MRISTAFFSASRNVTLAFVLFGAGCDDDPERDPPKGSDVEEDIDLGLESLGTSVGEVTPALDPATLDYGVAFQTVTTATVTAVARNPDATVTIGDAQGGELRLRTPLGDTVVPVTVRVGEHQRTYSLTLSRSGDYVEEEPIAAPNPPEIDEEAPNSMGYGFPRVSPDGRYISVVYAGDDWYQIHRFVDVYRSDGPDIEFEARIETDRMALGFCDADPVCLWSFRDAFEDETASWQILGGGEGAWSTAGPEWHSPSELPGAFVPLSMDAPHAAFLYGPEGAQIVPLGPSGEVGSSFAIPELKYPEGAAGSHVITADRTRLLHAIRPTDSDPGVILVFEQSASGWTKTQTITPVAPGTVAYGSAMLPSPDGADLWVGNSFAIVDGLLDAGEVEHFHFGGGGYELVETIHEPTPRAGAGFGGFLRGDPSTGRVYAGAVEGEPFSEEIFTVVYDLQTGAEASLHHPGGVLEAPRDASMFVGVAGDPGASVATLRVYR
jgi:hypothetical protein